MRLPALLLTLLLTTTVIAENAPVTAGLPAPQTQTATVLYDGPTIDSASLIRPESPDGACLKMRTYVMKREGIGDSTRLVKYYTCQKASKFGVKRAEEPAKDQR
jgi:hypothetical protein